jgi:signal-transduction protein with cAMP-binding, CBS, and nucleotidyltransferase domain
MHATVPLVRGKSSGGKANVSANDKVKEMRSVTKTIETFVKKVVTVLPCESLSSVARAMDQHNVGAVVIAENRKPVGIITDRDLALQLGAHGVSPQTPVVKVMTSPVQTVARDDGVFDTTQAMMELRVRRLPVVDDDGELVGLVTLDDLLRVLSGELSSLVQGVKSEMAVK